MSQPIRAEWSPQRAAAEARLNGEVYDVAAREEVWETEAIEYVARRRSTPEFGRLGVIVAVLAAIAAVVIAHFS